MNWYRLTYFDRPTGMYLACVYVRADSPAQAKVLGLKAVCALDVVVRVIQVSMPPHMRKVAPV